MREVVLDTESTGLDPDDGHRIVEIGCIELLNHVPTGQTYHQYVNPGRPMPADAAAVHGLTDERLATEPPFEHIAGAFRDFIADSPLIIHNAAFDIRFINAEFRRIGFAPIPGDRAIDTLAIARQRFPGAQASLDALCRRYGIDTSVRALHGALLDAELLAKVYLELIGGRQTRLGLTAGEETEPVAATRSREYRPPRPHAADAEELDAHARLLDKLGDDAVWRS